MLVCSTIIETGIDVPNANTIIIERQTSSVLHSYTSCVAGWAFASPGYAYLLVPS